MDTKIFYNLGIEFFDGKEYEKAIKCFDKELKINSNDISALNYKGKSLFFLGKDDKAENLFDAALKINPNDPLSL